MLTIVGAGLTGATIARLAMDDGHRVRVIERRRFVGGNTADGVWQNGQRYNFYGPHYFRTSSDRIWEFVSRFAEWRECPVIVNTVVDGNVEAFPILSSYVDKLCGKRWRNELPNGKAANFEEACLRRMPRPVYDRFVYGYSKKQWGCEPSELSAELAARVEVRDGDERRLKLDKYQGVPIDGYCAMVGNMLSGSELYLDVGYRDEWGEAPLLVYTGGIDEFFGYRLGKLPYRTQQREHYPGRLSCMQLNYPDIDVPFVREIDWRFSWDGPGFITSETPRDAITEDEREYPFPSPQAREMYERYARMALDYPHILFAGRLGEYRYYDMDMAVMRAMTMYTQWVKPRLAARVAA